MDDLSDTSHDSLPANPSLEQLKKRAKDLLAGARSSDEVSLNAFRQFLPHLNLTAIALHDAQTVIARSFGFANWSQLRERVDQVNVTAIADAVRAHDVRRLRRLLRLRPDLVNYEIPGLGEHRALHLAVLNRDLESTEVLLSAGANPEIGIYPHRTATSALTIARERDYTEIVAAIEADVRRRREASQVKPTSVPTEHEELNEAISRDDEEACERLLTASPTLLTERDGDGLLPIHRTAARLNAPLLRWILERVNDASTPDASGKSPLDHATAAFDPAHLDRFRNAAICLLSFGASLSARASVMLGDLTQISELYSLRPEAFRADIDTFRGGVVALATRMGRLDIVKFLVENGIDPDERVRVPEIEEEIYSSGFALWHAAGAGQYEIADVLLKAGSDVNAHVYASGNAFSGAYNARDERMEDLLRSYGAFLEAATIGLHGDLAAARTLLARIDNEGETRSSNTGADRSETEELLWGAACGGFPEIVALCLPRIPWQRSDSRWFEMLQQPLYVWGHHPHRKFQDTDRAAYPACLKLMLDAGVDPNVVGSFGRTLLHDVAALGVVWGQPIMLESERLEFASLLLAAGAKLDRRDDLLRSTPLGWAVRWNRRELAELLLAHGAPVEEPGAEPWATPLAWARKCGDAGMELLLEQHRGH